MLNREDMLELTRRMNLSRNCFFRIAGSYRDKEGIDEGSFNTSFLKLNQRDKIKNIEIAKTVVFAETNVELQEFDITGKDGNKAEFRSMLEALKECGLKNDALLDVFYDIMSERYVTQFKPENDFGIFMFYGSYDIKVKASDKEYMDDSEEVYSFLICAVCPVYDDYDPGLPECGFLYPSFKDRSMDAEHIAVMGETKFMPCKL
ncbi:MAG: DUF4317 domain-containing protein [Lachnospiraceae bacterium]|nr:DUF4317 domain-containing protein [Lachnospiraceae bacterium]